MWQEQLVPSRQPSPSAAAGTLAKTLAAEGGLGSALWAGHRKQGPVRIKLGVTLDDFDYDVELGLPVKSPGDPTLFELDPHFKCETLIYREKNRRTKILERGTSSCTIRDAGGRWVPYTMALHHAESVMNQIVDPSSFPLLDDVRRRFMKWRFYHGFRTDAESRLRRPQIGVRTYVMSPDGVDLAAALQTIRENGDDHALDAAVEDAFPGSKLHVTGQDGGFQVAMSTPGIHRPLSAKELSDGTLRYLCLLAALLSPSPAPLLALNEPETSLHEDLLPPLARLIAKVSSSSQIWLTTHSHILSETLAEESGVVPINLEKVDGATQRTGRPKGLAWSAEWDQ
jgi:predicted ATPase